MDFGFPERHGPVTFRREAPMFPKKHVVYQKSISICIPWKNPIRIVVMFCSLLAVEMSYNSLFLWAYTLYKSIGLVQYL